MQQQQLQHDQQQQQLPPPPLPERRTPSSSGGEAAPAHQAASPGALAPAAAAAAATTTTAGRAVHNSVGGGARHWRVGWEWRVGWAAGELGRVTKATARLTSSTTLVTWLTASALGRSTPSATSLSTSVVMKLEAAITSNTRREERPWFPSPGSARAWGGAPRYPILSPSGEGSSFILAICSLEAFSAGSRTVRRTPRQACSGASNRTRFVGWEQAAANQNWRWRRTPSSAPIASRAGSGPAGAQTHPSRKRSWR